MYDLHYKLLQSIWLSQSCNFKLNLIKSNQMAVILSVFLILFLETLLYNLSHKCFMLFFPYMYTVLQMNLNVT